MLLEMVYAERNRRQFELALMLACATGPINLNTVQVLKTQIDDLTRTAALLERSSSKSSAKLSSKPPP